MTYGTEVKYFSSFMPGAPVLNGNFGKIIEILDACLVNGWSEQSVATLTVSNGVATLASATNLNAAQWAVIEVNGAIPISLNGQKRVHLPPTATTVSFEATGISDCTAAGTITFKMASAGWAKPFAAANKAVYQSKNPFSTKTLYRIDDTTNYSCWIQGFESTNSTDIASGVGPFPSLGSSLFIPRSSIPDATPVDWFIVANDKFVFFGVRGMSPATPTYPYQISAWGDFKSRKPNDLFCAMIRGVSTSSSFLSPADSDSIGYNSGSDSSVARLCRDSTGLGGSIQFATQSLANASLPGLSGRGPIVYPNVSDGALILTEQIMIEGWTQSIRGTIPGMLVSPQTLTWKICATPRVLSILPIVPDMPGRVLLGASSGSSSSPGVTFFDIIGPWGN